MRDVLVPPRVIPEKMNVTVAQNGSILIPCNATGVPEPTIEWFKEPSVKIVGGASLLPHYTLSPFLPSSTAL